MDDLVLARVVDTVLGTGSPKASRKAFDRADMIVAFAPQLHGLPVSELVRTVDAVVAHPDCIPLLGVTGARTQVYATAGALAGEAHIAEVAGRLATAEPPGRHGCS